MSNTKKLLPLTLAIAACMAAPAAFAQSVGAGVNAGGVVRVEPPAATLHSQAGLHAQANPQVAAPAVPATPAVPAVPPVKSDAGTTAAVPAAPATPATPATPAKKSWVELDANGNGSLSATEAATMESLSKVFVKADADANGELTQDEYKTWLAANGKAKAKAKAGS